MTGECLVPTPQAGQQGYFLRSDNTWAEQSDKAKFLCSDGTWRIGDNDHLFLRGNARWEKMELGIRLSSLPIGSTVKFINFQGERIKWVIIGSNLTDMPSKSVTLMSKDILAIIPFDAQEPNNPVTTTGGTKSKALYGNNDWGVSNLRQWANSAASAGNWWSATTPYDKPPSPEYLTDKKNAYADWAGFLHEASSAEINALLDTDRIFTCYTNSGQLYNRSVDKIFLLTSSEYTYDTDANNGTAIPYLANVTNRLAYPTAWAANHNQSLSNVGSIKPESSWYNWTSSGSSALGSAASVRTSGYDARRTYTSSAYTDNMGFRPVCNLSESTLVSQTTDADGSYIIQL